MNTSSDRRSSSTTNITITTVFNRPTSRRFCWSCCSHSPATSKTWRERYHDKVLLLPAIDQPVARMTGSRRRASGGWRVDEVIVELAIVWRLRYILDNRVVRTCEQITRSLSHGI
jgi:hypothetical protein